MEPFIIKEKILNIMSLVFDTPVEQLNEESSVDNIENWDSLRQLNLIIALEEEFNISFKVDEIGHFVNYKIIFYFISNALQVKS